MPAVKKTYTLTDASRELGFKNHSRLFHLLKAGHLEGTYKTTGKKKLFNLEKLRTRIDATLAPQNRDRRGHAPGELTGKSVSVEEKKKLIDHVGDEIKTIGYAKAREIGEQYKAALLKLEYEEKQKKLIPVENIITAEAHAGRLIKDGLSSIPDRCAALCAAESDPRQVKLILQKEIDAVLNSISSGLLNFHE